jgi:predicted nucleic acid-binding protein
LEGEPLKVLVDTTIWSLALRRRAHDISAVERGHVGELAALTHEGRAALIGAVRQEVLSGIAQATRFEHLRGLLRDFDDEPVTTDDHEEAARHTNKCMRAGIAGSSIDFLICAVATRRDFAIYTADPDFDRYAKHLPIRLHHPRGRS